MHDPAGWAGTVVCMSGWLAAGLGSLPLATYRHGHDGRVRSRSAEPGAGRGSRLRWQREDDAGARGCGATGRAAHRARRARR